MAEVNKEKLYMLLSEMLSSIEENPDMVETELRNTYVTEFIYALGWPANSVETEKGVKLATTNHRVDYDLSYRGKSKVAIEIKRPKEPLSKDAESQLGDYLFKLKSDIGIAFNGISLTVMNTKGKPLARWKFDRSKGIPKNVKDLIAIFEKYLAYNSVIKGNFTESEEGASSKAEDNISVSKTEDTKEALMTEEESQTQAQKEGTSSKDQNKALFIFAYLFGFISGIIVLLAYGKNKRLRMHSLQSIMLNVISIFITFALFGLFLFRFASVLDLLIWIYGMYIGFMAYGGVDVNIPFVSDFISHNF